VGLPNAKVSRRTRRIRVRRNLRSPRARYPRDRFLFPARRVVRLPWRHSASRPRATSPSARRSLRRRLAAASGSLTPSGDRSHTRGGVPREATALLRLSGSNRRRRARTPPVAVGSRAEQPPRGGSPGGDPRRRRCCWCSSKARRRELARVPHRLVLAWECGHDAVVPQQRRSSSDGLAGPGLFNAAGFSRLCDSDSLSRVAACRARAYAVRRLTRTTRRCCLSCAMLVAAPADLLGRI
jgi:hypothetical protein